MISVFRKGVEFNDPDKGVAQWSTGRVDGNLKVTVGNYNYETKVENIKAGAGVHEYWSHGHMKIHDMFNNHYKAYENTINSEYWSSTTPRFKTSTMSGLNSFYNAENVPMENRIRIKLP